MGDIMNVFDGRQKSALPALVGATLWLVFPAAVFADRASEVAALEARCEQDREARIKPRSEMEIKTCVANRSDLDYCTTFWKDYGNAVRLKKRCNGPPDVRRPAQLRGRV
jgi:hypothetical protein